MKKLIATTLACSVLGLAAYAQGTINLANFVSGSINAPIYQSDGVTKLVGPTYMAGLYAGPTAGSMAFIGSVAFLTGGGAGFFPATTETVNTVAPGATAFVQVVAWNVNLYATFQLAHDSGAQNVWGESGVYQIVTGGAGSPPSVPAPITGLTSFSLVGVPEPGTFALAGLGAAAALIFRRRQ